MAAIPYMPLYVADYLSDARHLTTTEHGAYLLLIMTYWQTGKPLPDDDKKLARISGLTPRQWSRCKTNISEFFFIAGKQWRHLRIDTELQKVTAKSLKKRKAGLARAKQMHSSCSADAKLSDTDTDTDIKVISNDITKRRGRKRLNGVNSGFPKPDWAGDILWQDFLANRKTKRLTNTATAYAKFMADIKKYTAPDWPPKRILEYAVAKGWGAIYQPETDTGTARGNHHGADNAIGTTDQAARKVLDQIRNADNAERQPAQPPSIMPSRGGSRLSGPMSSALLPSHYD